MPKSSGIVSDPRCFIEGIYYFLPVDLGRPRTLGILEPLSRRALRVRADLYLSF